MKKSYVSDIISAINASEDKTVDVTYNVCDGNVYVMLNGNAVDVISENEADGGFAQKFEADVNEVATEMNLPTLHSNTRQTTLTFSHIGYCSMSNIELPYVISIKQTVDKKGIRTERRSITSAKIVREYMDKYPAYELYICYGLLATPRKVSRQNIEEELNNKNYVAFDIDVIDDEIHVTTLTIGALM